MEKSDGRILSRREVLLSLGTTVATGLAGCLDEDGPEDWVFESGFGGMYAGPVVADGTLYVTSMGSVHEIDPETGEDAWTTETDRIIYARPTVDEGSVYVPVHGRGVYALEADSGERRWQADVDVPPFATLAAADGLVYGPQRDPSGLYAIDVDAGTEAWSSDVELRYPEPVVADGTVFIESLDSVTAIDGETGDEVWQFERETSTFTSATVVDGTVYVGSKDDKIYAIDATSGEERWQTTLPIQSTPVVAAGVIYVGVTDGLTALEADTGDERWQFGDGTEVVPWTVADGTLYATDLEHTFHAIDGETGDERWQFETDADLGPAAAADGTAYVGADDGAVYAVSDPT